MIVRSVKMKTKKCRDCKNELVLDWHFNVDNKNKDKKRNECKACQDLYRAKIRYQEDIDNSEKRLKEFIQRTHEQVLRETEVTPDSEINYKEKYFELINSIKERIDNAR